MGHDPFLLRLASGLYMAKQAGLASFIRSAGQAATVSTAARAAESALPLSNAAEYAARVVAPKFREDPSGWLSHWAHGQLGGIGVPSQKRFLSWGADQGVMRPQFTVPEVMRMYRSAPGQAFKQFAGRMGPLEIGFLGLGTAMSLPQIMNPATRGEGLGRTAGMWAGWMGLPSHMPMLPQLALWQLAESAGGKLGKIFNKPAPPVPPQVPYA